MIILIRNFGEPTPKKEVQIIKNKHYTFNEKDKLTNIFDTVAKSSEGLFQPYFNKDIKSQSYISRSSLLNEEHPELQEFMSNFKNSTAPRLSDPIIS